MLDLEYSNAFFDDLKKQNKSGFDREVLNNVVEILRNKQPTATLSSGIAFGIEWTRARAALSKGSISPTSLDPTHRFIHYACNRRVSWSLRLVREHGRK